MVNTSHFLDIDHLDSSYLRKIIEVSKKIKKEVNFDAYRLLKGKTLAMLFDKPSTRTRVSFELAMKQLGGDVVVLSQENTHLGKGKETVSDTAKVLSRYVDVIMIRTHAHNTLTDLANNSSVPVINGLTDKTHPCQVLSDIMTYEEHRGNIKNAVITWVGDGNNVANSWIHAAQKFNFELRVSCPENLLPEPEIIKKAHREETKINLVKDPGLALKDADCIVTDTWSSMGEDENSEKFKQLKPYRIDSSLMSLAKSTAIFMHCLPANRNQEVDSSVIDGPQSVVWDEAENRLHIQKGILLGCLGHL